MGRFFRWIVHIFLLTIRRTMTFSHDWCNERNPEVEASKMFLSMYSLGGWNNWIETMRKSIGFPNCRRSRGRERQLTHQGVKFSIVIHWGRWQRLGFMGLFVGSFMHGPSYRTLKILSNLLVMAWSDQSEKKRAYGFYGSSDRAPTRTCFFDRLTIR